MLMPPEGRVKYPPRSYPMCGDLSGESRLPQPQRDLSEEFNAPCPNELPQLFRNGGLGKDSLQDLATHPPQSSIIDDWTWESFSIGIGAGTIHLILADLNHHSSKVVMAFEVLFYFTDVITFMCNIGIFITQQIRNSRRGAIVKNRLENTDKSATLSLIPINLAMVLIGSFRYGLASGWLQYDGAICFFHCYIILLISLLTPHFLVWFKVPHTLERLPTNFYLLPIPTFLTGVMASHLLKIVPFDSLSSLNVLVLGSIFSGFSLLLALFYLFVFFFRMLLHGHGNGEQTVVSILVAAFPAFCAHTMISLGQSSRIIFVESPILNLSDTLGEVWYGAGILAGLMLLGLSLTLVLMTLSNSWWKKSATNKSPTKLTLWMISVTCCSWAISSACNPLCIIFESMWLRGVQLIFVTSGIATYLVILPMMITRYFKKISGSRDKCKVTWVCTPIGLPPPLSSGNEQVSTSTELDDFSFYQHRNLNPYTQSGIPSPHSKPLGQTRNSLISQSTLVGRQNSKSDPNSSPSFP